MQSLSPPLGRAAARHATHSSTQSQEGELSSRPPHIIPARVRGLREPCRKCRVPAAVRVSPPCLPRLFDAPMSYSLPGMYENGSYLSAYVLLAGFLQKGSQETGCESPSFVAPSPEGRQVRVLQPATSARSVHYCPCYLPFPCLRMRHPTFHPPTFVPAQKYKSWNQTAVSRTIITPHFPLLSGRYDTRSSQYT